MLTTRLVRAESRELYANAGHAGASSRLVDAAERVLYTCADVLATLSPSRSQLSRGSRNHESECVAGDVESAGGGVETLLTGSAGRDRLVGASLVVAGMTEGVRS
jgi:hypothetical protein